jgi:hypothetical protein
MSTIREALEAAAGEPSGDEIAEAAPVEEAAAVNNGGGDEGATAGVEAAGDTAAADAEDATAETKPGEAGRSRDGKGRFAPGTEAAKATPAVSTKPTLPGAAQTVKPTPGTAASVAAKPVGEPLKPPQSWTPAAREAFAKAPPEVQAEVNRRERQMASAMQDSAQARRFHETFNAVLAPHSNMIQQEAGGDPVRVVSSLLQTAQALRGSQAPHVIAALVRQFRIPIADLDQALADGPQSQPAQRAQQLPEYRDPRVDQLLQRAEQQQAQRIQKEIDDFAQGAEFFQDVRPRVAALIGEGGMTLPEAYDSACWSNPQIRGILQQREAAKAANAGNASTQRARAAASSVKGQPAGATAPQPNGVRAALEAAASRLSGR